ncbi:NADH:flavin oxidoreductase/NADH oxidase [Commensalibacter oyaizuii]|uniref:NADH:flavin oxidoreductase/NADH oxidase n=1 Tax=Commensalibacter oyaizuii TaxID=3043873 RepID=A0ABT6Q3Q6_9PROT|nr:NADH:flavin oxidoreductase/NADH oxidase [Commensalibacter sp. TBRC 16381]MDI2091759.1 NADH:flavin oxidoreductase/NADH oxidase [Commensalibacter sp. TBRC 16381]
MIHLFEPWSIGNLTLENRIIIPPMCQYSAQDGKMSDWHRIHIGSMLTSGAGLFIIEATGVSPEGRISPYCVGLWSDETQQAMADVLRSVRQYSSMPIAIQLAHAGRKASTYEPWKAQEKGERLIPQSDPLSWQPIAPSAIPFLPDDPAPTAMTIEDIHQTTQAFVNSAKRSEAIGINGIELHMAHGYLVHEFLSPLSNHRQDSYGGSLENRMRFALEIYKAVYDAVQIPVWVRISATDWVDKGWNLDEAIILCKALKALGCPAIHVSTAGLSPQQKIPAGPGFQVSFAHEIRKQAAIPTIAVGLISEPETAEAILASGQADAVAIGRSILANPHWPWVAAQRLNRKITTVPQYWRGKRN